MSTAELALVIAGYAALVSTAALGWQVWLRHRQRTPGIAVSVRHAGPFGRMMVESIENPPRSKEGTMAIYEEYTLIVAVVNNGETTEVVEALGLDLLPPPGGGRRDPPFWHNERNETLAPGGAIKQPIPVRELLPGGNPAGLEFVAFVALASGRRIEAPPDGVAPDFWRLGGPKRWRGPFQ